MVMMMMMVMVMTLLFIPKIELLFSHRQHCHLCNFTFFLILRRLPQPPESGCRISPNLAKLAKTAFFAKNPSPRYFLMGKFFQMRVDFLQVRMTLWHMPSLILSVFCPMTIHFLSENGFSHIFSTLGNQHGRRWPFLIVALRKYEICGVGEILVPPRNWGKQKRDVNAVFQWEWNPILLWNKSLSALPRNWGSEWAALRLWSRF